MGIPANHITGLYLPLARVEAVRHFPTVDKGGCMAHLVQQQLQQLTGLPDMRGQLKACLALQITSHAQGTAGLQLSRRQPVDPLAQAAVEDHVVEQPEQRLGQRCLAVVEALLTIAERQGMAHGKGRVRCRNEQVSDK